MDANLERPRPDEWSRGDLFRFIEDCWNNSLAIVGNNNVVAARLTAIDSIFYEIVQQGIKPANAAEVVPVLLYLRSFNAFRASVMVGLSMANESFALQRSCLENAGYAKIVMRDVKLSALWLQRDHNLAEVRKQFTNRAVREAIATDDEPLSKVYQDLYERSIDFGAHPNEKGVLGSVVPTSVNTGTMQVTLLGGDNLQLQHGLKSCAQAGICSLKIFNLIFPDHFAKANFATNIETASRPF